MTVLRIFIVCCAFVYLAESTFEENENFTLKEFLEFKENLATTLHQYDIKYRQQESEVKGLRKRVRDLEKLTENTEYQLSKCSKRIDKLEFLLKTEISKVPYLQTDEFQNETYDVDQDLTVLHRPSSLGLFQTNRKTVIRNSGGVTPKAAFFAHSGDLSNLGANQIVIFKYVLTNIGNMYSGSTGVFTCGVTGTYVFHVSLVSEGGQDVRIYLAKNGVPMMHVLAPNIPDEFGTGSSMAVLQVQSGDTVVVKSQYIHGGPALDYWTYFSGFLLYS